MFRRLIPILISVLLASSAVAGQSWVGPGAWVDLGPAPVAVTPMAGASVYLQQGASAPANTSAASLVGGASTAVAASMTFAGTQHVFAIGAPGALQVQVDVEAVVAAASTPAIASDGGGMAHITNWPSVFAVTWSGQSVAISNWPTTQAVSWSGQSVAATQSGVWNVGLAAGSNTVGNVGVNNNPVGSGAFATSQAPIGTAAAQIVAARTGASGTGRISVTLYNFGSATVFIGASGVTAANGLPLAARASLTIDTMAAVFGVAASGTQTVGALESF